MLRKGALPPFAVSFRALYSAAERTLGPSPTVCKKPSTPYLLNKGRQVTKLTSLVAEGRSQPAAPRREFRGYNCQKGGARSQQLPRRPQAPTPREGGKYQAPAWVSLTANDRLQDSLLRRPEGQCPVAKLEVLGMKIEVVMDTGSQVSTSTRFFLEGISSPAAES
ncbi:hypothetical protein ElyMa_006561800 [Elysia marginata]|uniref:Retropepsins domain-containing protein n=1 Tax=Elysia marginata TaxID=1093978 RepID=A0AAV4IBW8_9GAST|nr:hypothetical protein ElyMa_006561800 [Elysia marginata]